MEYCYFCLKIIASGVTINYTYTVPITGVVNGSIAGLVNLSVLAGIFGNANASNQSYTYSSGGKTTTVGIAKESCYRGVDFCRWHLYDVYLIG